MLLDEADCTLHRTEASLLVPGVFDLFSVVGVPAPGAIAQPHVEPHTNAASLTYRLLTVGADLHDSGGAGAQQLDHGIGEAGVRGFVIHRHRAHWQLREEPREVKLAPS